MRMPPPPPPSLPRLRFACLLHPCSACSDVRGGGGADRVPDHRLGGRAHQVLEEAGQGRGVCQALQGWRLRALERAAAAAAGGGAAAAAAAADAAGSANAEGWVLLHLRAGGCAVLRSPPAAPLPLSSRAAAGARGPSDGPGGQRRRHAVRQHQHRQNRQGAAVRYCGAYSNQGAHKECRWCAGVWGAPAAPAPWHPSAPTHAPFHTRARHHCRCLTWLPLI